ncbi:DUF4082 domain-containing protein [Armatimonas sp.]|uniref:DUF4082 domain-containing protein n=1 Tax=Armatimonas sp. TaxID=1872638 RepID=UPI003752B1EF
MVLHRSRFSLTRGTLATLMLLGLATLPQMAQAQTAAIDFTSSGSNTAATTSTRGYEFNITSSVTVTGLSFFDLGSDGLAQAHDVGLWDSSGTLLASVNVPSGTTAPLDSSGKFRFVTLGSSVTLPVATAYRVGAVFVAGSPDQQFISQVGLTNAPGVSYVQGAFINNGVNALTFPTGNLGVNGLSGGSFVIGAASSAPEPGTLALLALGIVGGVVARRRK